jgi:hypothetical protein
MRSGHQWKARGLMAVFAGVSWLAGIVAPALGQTYQSAESEASQAEAPPAPAPRSPAVPAPAPKPPAKGKPPAPTPPPAAAPATPAPPATSAPAQSGPPSTDTSSLSDLSTGLSGDTQSLLDSSVGYIDPALVGNQVRLRFDAAYRDNRPSRAEFLYAEGRNGRELPLPETRVDYQELSAYLEGKLAHNLSAFVETPVRFLNPEINADHTGFGDMNAGFKYALVNCPDLVTTFQLRTYVPTGDPRRGLGTDHVSLEPALLVWERLTDRVNLYGELRYWIPIGGTDFAGDVIRYGIGVSYGKPCEDGFWVTPVVELVGWTVLDGKEAVSTIPLGEGVKDASGDTIVNAKFGARLGYGNRADFYAGYGRALTGDVWYKDILRVEFRLLF